MLVVHKVSEKNVGCCIARLNFLVSLINLYDICHNLYAVHVYLILLFVDLWSVCWIYVYSVQCNIGWWLIVKLTAGSDSCKPHCVYVVYMSDFLDIYESGRYLATCFLSQEIMIMLWTQSIQFWVMFIKGEYSPQFCLLTISWLIWNYLRLVVVCKSLSLRVNNMVGGGILNLINSLKSQVATFGRKCPTNPIITLLNAPL